MGREAVGEELGYDGRFGEGGGDDAIIETEGGDLAALGQGRYMSGVHGLLGRGRGNFKEGGEVTM